MGGYARASVSPTRGEGWGASASAAAILTVCSLLTTVPELVTGRYIRTDA
jgi:hypothetical protein